MKRFTRILCMLLTLVMLQSIFVPKIFAEEGKKSITILFTHDTHDHFLPCNVEKNGKNLELGGYERLQNAINAEKEKNSNVLLVHGGDYSMGTLFQSIYSSDAPQLRTLGQMGYDAVTFGNHEYDFRSKGLADSLRAAKNSGDKLPQIVQSNVSFPSDKNGNMSKSLADLKQAMKEYGVKDYTVIERGGIKVGVFGLMGKNADDCAPMAEVKFNDALKESKRVVKELKEKEKVDLIVCLSHSGISEDKSKSEDEILAKKVPEIDVIVSGHTHTELAQPIMVGKTIIGSCGEYCENLGIINISQDNNKRWKLNNYNLKPIDKSLDGSSDISKTIEDFKKVIQKKYLDKFGLKYDEVLAYSPFKFVPSSEIGKKHAEDTLANLISDAYIYAVKKAEGENYEPITVAMVPSGTIRGSFIQGNITVPDAFNASSLGIGPDRISGYPLISVYLTGKELKTACEVDASITPIMSAAQLYMSGISYTFNPNRLLFNKVTKVQLQKKDGFTEEIDDKKLYRAVAGLYSAQMLSVVGEKSFGLLSIVPKTKDGIPIKDFEAQIIKDTASGRNNEVKEWLAIAQYLKSFEKVNGVSQVPQYYSKTQGRKVIDNNSSFQAKFGQPNHIILMAYTIIGVIVAIIIFVVVMIVKRRKRKAITKKPAAKI